VASAADLAHEGRVVAGATQRQLLLGEQASGVAASHGRSHRANSKSWSS
jgi:hypothetical protein